MQWRRTSSDSGLWLPEHHFGEQLNSMSDQSPLDYMGVTLTYEQAFGEVASWAKFRQLLDGYSIEGICNILTRISILLHKDQENPETQVKILSGIFGPDGDQVLGAVHNLENEIRRRNNRSKILIFTEQQLVNFLKAAFLTKSLEDENTCDSFRNLGRSILMITDLTQGQPGSLDEVREQDIDFQDRWIAYLLSNFLFNNWEYGPNALARSFDIHMTDREYLQECGSYVDLPTLFKETTNVDPIPAWGAMFQFTGYWTSVANPDDESSPMAVNAESFLNQYDFSEEENERFLKLAVGDAQEVQAQVLHSYSLENLSPYHFLPLARYPFIRFGNKIYCPVLKLALEKLTKGLHYFYLDESIPSTTRQKYLTYKGEVFQDYVDQLLNRCFPPTSNRFLSLDEIRPEFVGQYCDGLIHYGDSLILIETKASLFSIGARSGTNSEDIYNRLKDIFVDASMQIQATIDFINAGGLESQGFTRHNIHRYYPIVITLEDISMSPLVYDQVQQMIDVEGLLQAEAIMPYQCVDIGELELLESALGEGLDLKELLDRKISDQVGLKESLRNFVHRSDETFLSETNEHLKHRFHCLGEEVFDFFTTHSRQQN